MSDKEGNKIAFVIKYTFKSMVTVLFDSELTTLFFQPLDYRISTNINQIIIMFKLGFGRHLLRKRKSRCILSATDGH